MKRTILLLGGTLLLCLCACKKLRYVSLEAHNYDQMMDSTHAIINRLDTLKATNDPDIDYTKTMLLLERGIIGMAQLEVHQGSNDSLKRTAQKIINEQQKEMQQLTTLLPLLKLLHKDTAFTALQKSNLVKMDKTADIQLLTGEMDNDFATLIVVHHQLAVDNALAWQYHGYNATLKTIATNAISMRSAESVELSNWLIANKR